MNASANATQDSQDAPNVQPSTPKIPQIPQAPTIPIKQAEFQAFLATLKTPGVKAHWKEVAEALGVSPDTITDWSKLPEAIEARKEGIRLSLQGMETAGMDDWKMYQAKLRMLNVKTNEPAEGGGGITNNTLIVLADALKSIASKDV